MGYLAARRISGAGFVGLLATANSLNACLPLKMAELKEPKFPAFLLIERGGCSFVTKVQYAQDAGYAAAIVFDNEDSQELVTSKCYTEVVVFEVQFMF